LEFSMAVFVSIYSAYATVQRDSQYISAETYMS
jgi:hypothetical protein